MTRLSLRRVGALTGKLAAAPGSLADLLALATKKLKLASPATRLFASSGDELEDDDDVLLLRDEEVVYISCGEEYYPPTTAEPAAPAAKHASPAVEPAVAAAELAPPAAEPAVAAVELPPPAADPQLEAADPGNAVDDAVAQTAATAKAAPAPISEQATREMIKATPPPPPPPQPRSMSRQADPAIEALVQEDSTAQHLDPTLKALMEESFGPSAEEQQQSTDRVERGLDKIAALSMSDAGIQFCQEVADSLAPSALQDVRQCFRCAAPSPRASCSKCGVASYCGRECQTKDWGGKTGAWGGHKTQCAAYKALGRAQEVAPADRCAVIEAKLVAMRLYLCPFAICHGSAMGTGAPRGFAFVQFGCSLAQLALPVPQDCAGRPLDPGERSALVQFVTLAEFDADIVQSDSRLGAVQEKLHAAVDGHDDHKHCVVLVRSSCGFTAVVLQLLVPDWRVSRTLAEDCAGKEGAMQIDLDDL